jgi:hypothetical protein
MAHDRGDVTIGDTSGQVVVGDNNRSNQVNVGGDPDGKPPRDLPWKIIGAVTAVVSAVAAVIALFVA